MTVTGYVISAYDGQPLPNAHIYVTRDGLPHGTTANLEGAYSLTVLPDELVHVSYVGHESETVNANDYRGEPVVHTLEPTTLDEFEVVADRPKKSAWLALIFLLGLGAAVSR